MKSYPVYHVDSFTSEPFRGNPAGVVLDAGGMTPAEMQLVARELKHSETAFILSSRKADYRIRFFTPVREVDLCGHATIAAAWVQASEGRLKRGRCLQETNVGILELEIGRDRVSMELAPPRVEPVDVKREPLAELLGVPALHSSLPLQKAYSGLWVLIVPMTGYLVLNGIAPGPEFKVRQGDAMGRPGELEVYATAKGLRIRGRAVILSRGSLSF